jgi:hemoglobin
MERLRLVLVMFAMLAILGAGACGDIRQKRDDFYTSGSRDADQRAEQRMARDQQLKGKSQDGLGGGDAQLTLYERLGGDEGLRRVVDDFVQRLVADPRVNFQRRGIDYTTTWTRKSAEWDATPGRLSQIKNHFTQFLALATGGPAARYTGPDLKSLTKDMKFTNAQFDAGIGDLKSSLDRLGVATPEQKELLAIVESTRPQVVTVR